MDVLINNAGISLDLFAALRIAVETTTFDPSWRKRFATAPTIPLAPA